MAKEGKKLSLTQMNILQKKNVFLNELVRQNYNITHTCKALKTGITTYYNWIRSDPDFVKMLERLRDQEVDVIEDAFRDLVKERNPQAVIFGLKTRGANRGYQEKQQIEHFGAQAIVVKFVDPGDPVEEEEEDEKTIHDNDKADS